MMVIAAHELDFKNQKNHLAVYQLTLIGFSQNSGGTNIQSKWTLNG